MEEGVEAREKITPPSDEERRWAENTLDGYFDPESRLVKQALEIAERASATGSPLEMHDEPRALEGLGGRLVEERRREMGKEPAVTGHWTGNQISTAKSVLETSQREMGKLHPPKAPTREGQ